MAKTKPIGVRFRPEVLEKLNKEHGIDSPQAALVFLERFYCQHWKLTKDITAPLRDKENELTFKKAAKKQNKAHDEANLNSDIEYTTPTQDAYDGSKMSHIAMDEIGQYEAKPPKTLDELKLLCPKELTGFDRSQWIASERQKYGI